MSKLASTMQRFSVAQVISHLRTPLFRNAYALIVSNAAASLLGFVYWVVAARFYPAAQVGISSAMISTMIFLAGVSQLNMNGVLMRFIPCAGRATSKLVLLAYTGSVAITALIGVIFVLGIDTFAPNTIFLKENPLLLVLVITTSMLYCIFALQDGVLAGLRQAIWVPIENTLFGVAKIAALIAFAAPLQQYGIIASWTVPIVLAIIPMNLLIFVRLIPAHVAATEHQAVPLQPRQLVTFVAGDYAGSLIGRATVAILPLMVLQLVGAEANAYYYLAWTIAYSLQLVSINMGASVTVESATDQQAFVAHGRRALIQLARLLVPAVLCIVIGAPYLLRLFGPDYAAEGTTLLRLLALAALPHTFIALYNSYARVQRRVSRIVLLAASLGAIVIGLSYLLIDSYGITAIGIAWLTAELVIAVVLAGTVFRPILNPATRLPPPADAGS